MDKSCNTDFTADCVINSINIQIIYKEIAIRADYKSGAPVHCLSQTIVKINPTFDYVHILSNLGIRSVFTFKLDLPRNGDLKML